MTGGVKNDGKKLPWHLLPWDVVTELVKVLQFGARKYGERNWEKGIDYSRTFAATHRHMVAWWLGEDNDPETGISHLAHAACEIMFALAFAKRGSMDLDDRPSTRIRSHYRALRLDDSPETD